MRKYEENGTIETTEKYWDCACVEDYIHSKCERFCFKCGSVEEESSDSRASEVELLIINSI